MTWFDDAKKLLERGKAREQVVAQFWASFTPRALKSIHLAQAQAKQINRNYIGTEHLLLGLLSLGDGVVVNILK